MSFSIYGISLISRNLAHANRLLMAITVLLVLDSTALADLLLSANASSNIGSSTPTQTGTSGTVSDSAGGRDGTDLAIARTSARFGELKAYSFASSTSRGYFGVLADNTASFKDDWLIDAPGKTGTTGFVDVKFTIDGTLEASRTGAQIYDSAYENTVRANASYTYFGGNGNTLGNKSETVRTAQFAARNGRPARSGNLFLGIEQTYTVQFTYGTLLEGVGLELRTSAISIGNFDFTSMAKADLEHTAKWGGFGEVRDANGNIVNDYSFSSASGFDYTQGITAVPEPSSCALMAIGAGFCLSRRTRMFRKKK